MRAFVDSFWDRCDVVEALMSGEPKIVYNGIAIYVNDAVRPDELWSVSGNWHDTFMVKQELKVSNERRCNGSRQIDSASEFDFELRNCEILEASTM